MQVTVMIDAEKKHNEVIDCIESLLEFAVEHNFQDVFAVGIDAAGTPRVFMSGDSLKCGLASAVLQTEFTKGHLQFIEELENA